MSLSKINENTNNLYINNREQLIPYFFFVGYICLLAQYLQSGVFSFFVSLFLCSVAHGYVVCAMHVADDEKPTLKIRHSLVGLTDFRRVFPTYFVRKLIIIGALGLCIIPLVIINIFSFPEFSISWIESVGNRLIQTELFIPNLQLYLPLFQSIPATVDIILCVLLYLLLNVFFSFMPYIIEEDDYSWVEAISKSFKIIKGNLKEMFQLYFHYAPRYLIYGIIAGVITSIVGPVNEVVMLVCLVASLFVYITVFKGRFEIAKYLLYKEIVREGETS